MIRLVWTALKAFGRFLKIQAPNFVIIGLCSYIFFYLNDINKELIVIEKQNLQAYNVQAEVNGKIVEALTMIANYAQQVNAASLQRDVILADFLKSLDAKITEAENQANKTADESVKRDSILGSFLKGSEEKPSYDYLKSMIVYLVEQHGDTKMVWIGTGTVIKVDEAANETYILTNKHVCDFAEGSTCFVYQDKVKYQISLVKQNEVDHDMQVVKTSEVVPGKIAVKGIKDSKPQDRIFFVGHNHGNPFMYSEGTVSGFMRGTGDLLVGAPSGPGNSGSGIFTQDGYLTGLLFAGQIFELESGNTMDTSHGICVNASILRLFLDEYFK